VQPCGESAPCAREREATWPPRRWRHLRAPPVVFGPRGWRGGRGDHDPPSTPLRASPAEGFGPPPPPARRRPKLASAALGNPSAIVVAAVQNPGGRAFQRDFPYAPLTLRTKSAAAPVGAHRCYARGMARAEKKSRTRIYQTAHFVGAWHTKQGRSQ